MRHNALRKVTWSFILRFMLLAALPLSTIIAGRTQEEQRVALVIGYGAYSESPLRNPVNDARDMAAALQQLGFAVTLKLDVNQNEMKRSINDFGERIKGGGGLFYFAGTQGIV